MIATCSGCDARWTSRVLAHCGACHAQFGGVGAFDLHRRALACVDPAEVAGLELGDDGIWHVRLSDAARDRLAALGAGRSADENADSASECQLDPSEAPGRSERVSS